MNKNPRKFYRYTIQIGGWGSDAHSAYNDAVNMFAADPGETPNNYEIIYSECPVCYADVDLTDTKELDTHYI